MNWEKYTWNDGDQITAQKLNHLEYGISRSDENSESSAALIVNEIVTYHEEDYSLVESKLDKDFNTIYTAFTSGIPIILKTFDGIYCPLKAMEYRTINISFINPTYSYLDEGTVKSFLVFVRHSLYHSYPVWLNFLYHHMDGDESLYPQAEYNLAEVG